jgi:hypothetical protein
LYKNYSKGKNDMDKIRIDVGVDTLLQVDLTGVDFENVSKVIFTVKNYLSINEEPIIEREFTTAEIHSITISAAESVRLAESAEYDFQKVLNGGTRIKISDNGKLELRRSVGDKID